jgi:hypothetical protein
MMKGPFIFYQIERRTQTAVNEKTGITAGCL